MLIKKAPLTLCLVFLINPLPIFSSAGTLDTTYGPNNTGIVTAAIGRNNTLDFIATQTDDSIVGVGSVTISETASGLCRFTTNGELDPSFNGIGYKQLIVGSKTLLNSIALQPDGKAVVGGYVADGITKFILARYDMTGALDTTFGGTGYVITDFGGSSSITAVLIQPDGKIIAGGVAGQGTPSFALARYNSDGSLDTSFGNGGISQVNPGYVSTINALALQTDGKIIAAGYAWNFATDVCALARFNTDGTLDTTFGNQGTVTTQTGQASRASSVAIQQDGNIIIGGYTTNDYTHYFFTLARYDTTGALDISFNGTGIVITTINYSSEIKALAIQSDGNILAGGYDFGARTTTFALARYLPAGILDQTFGTNGIALTAIGSSAQINSLAIQSDGKILAAGTADDYAAIVRYNS